MVNPAGIPVRPKLTALIAASRPRSEQGDGQENGRRDGDGEIQPLPELHDLPKPSVTAILSVFWRLPDE
jgi:hypothetical protein